MRGSKKLMRTILMMAIALMATRCSSVRTSPVVHNVNLTVKKGETFELVGNSFVIDSLILNDGAGIYLDKSHKKTVIRINYLQFGHDCFIAGVGYSGYSEPVRSSNGVYFGVIGHSGTAGIDLLLHCSVIAPGGNLLINLNGGSGAPGGSPGTDMMRVASNPLTRNATATTTSFRVPLQSVTRLPTFNDYPRTTNGEGGRGGDLLMTIPASYDKDFKRAITISNEGGFGAHENPDKRNQAAAGSVKVIPTKE